MPFILPPLRLLVLVWAVAETLAFVAVAHWIGTGGALLAGLATTLLGALLLRRLGAAATLRLRAALSGRGGDASGVLVDGGLHALSAAALLLPGFLTDLMGLALAVPPVRTLVKRRLGRGGEPGFGADAPRRGPRVVDLAPDEWSARPPTPADDRVGPRA